MSFLVLTISIGHFGVLCQYIQYRPNLASSLSARLASALSDKQYDTAPEYEYYYDDEIDGTTQTFAPTTITTKVTTTTTKKTTTAASTTTTPKPITSYRLQTTHRNGFRPILSGNNANTKKKTDTTITRQSNQPDNYIEASNDENTFIQKQKSNNNQPKQLASTQHHRNGISDVSRRSASKDYAQEKSSPAEIDSNNSGSSGGFSRRYARFLFKLRSG